VPPSRSFPLFTLPLILHLWAANRSITLHDSSIETHRTHSTAWKLQPALLSQKKNKKTEKTWPPLTWNKPSQPQSKTAKSRTQSCVLRTEMVRFQRTKSLISPFLPPFLPPSLPPSLPPVHATSSDHSSPDRFIPILARRRQAFGRQDWGLQGYPRRCGVLARFSDETAHCVLCYAGC